MPESGAEPEWSTNEGAAALVKAKEAVRGAGDANAGARAEHKGATGRGCGTARAGEGAEPERAWGAKVCAVEVAIDAERGGETSRAACEIEQAGGFALLLHLLDALQGLERSDQNTTPDAGDFGTDIEHEVIAVAEIDVGVTAAQKHGAIARSRSAKVVRGRVTPRVGFGFHDATAEPNAGEFADDNFADQKAGKRHGVRRQFGAAKTPYGSGSFAGCHGWQARQSSGG